MYIEALGWVNFESVIIAILIYETYVSEYIIYVYNLDISK